MRVWRGFDGHCHDLPFEHLVLAFGASTNFFGLPGVEANALTLRTINDAVALRSRLISHLEEARLRMRRSRGASRCSPSWSLAEALPGLKP